MWKIFQKRPKKDPNIIGLLQALTVLVYCGLISLLFWRGDSLFSKIPDVVGTILVLGLLVFSAAFTGAVVFGLSIYLFFQKQVRLGIQVFSYTLLYLFLIILLLLTFLVFI